MKLEIVLLTNWQILFTFAVDYESEADSRLEMDIQLREELEDTSSHVSDLLFFPLKWYFSFKMFEMKMIFTLELHKPYLH